MKTLLTILCLGFSILMANAQNSNQQYFLKLYNGETIFGDDITYETPIMKRIHFLVDGSVKVRPDSVAFFKIATGTLANCRKVEEKGNSKYAFRIKKGKLNLYETVDIAAYGGKELMLKKSDDGVESDLQIATGQKVDFYSKDDCQLKCANYRNLKMDVKDNEKSFGQLKKWRNIRWLQVAMGIAGASMTSYGFATVAGPTFTLKPSVPIGLILVTGAGFLQVRKNVYKDNTLYYYND